MSESNFHYPNGLATVLPEDSEQTPVQAYFTPPQKRKYNVKWLLLWQDSSEIGVSVMEQAKTEKMTLSDYRVRDFLIGTIGIGNFVFVNQRELTRELNLNKATVNRSIKHLIALNILIPGPKSGRSNTYMINPAFCFSGGLNNGIQQRKEAIKEHRANIIQFKSE